MVSNDINKREVRVMSILGFRPISRLTLTMTVIAVIAAGAMGANVGRKLVDAGNIVLTDLDGRSDATRKRAHDAGMIHASWTDIIRKADMILSIIPPRDAFSFAERVLAEFQDNERIDKAPLVFADCNAVNVVTIKKIAALFSTSSIVFLDACIIGGPPSGDCVPTFYGSADVVDQQGLTLFKNVIEKSGIKVRILSGDGAGIGDASALKMSYAASISLQLLVLTDIDKFLLRVFLKV